MKQTDPDAAYEPTIHFVNPKDTDPWSGTACGVMAEDATADEDIARVTCGRCKRSRVYKAAAETARLEESIAQAMRTGSGANPMPQEPVAPAPVGTVALLPYVSGVDVVEYLMDALGVTIADIARKRGV